MTIEGGAGDLGSFCTSFGESREPQLEVLKEDGEDLNQGKHEGLDMC